MTDHGRALDLMEHGLKLVLSATDADTMTHEADPIEDECIYLGRKEQIRRIREDILPRFGYRLDQLEHWNWFDPEDI
jgi:hypothetical protein